MPKRPSTLTATAGEHFVAYKLSVMGYPVALTKGGTPTVDLMVGNLDGNAVSVQVKTSDYAFRKMKRKPEDSHWEWDVGRRALELRSSSVFYAFVDLSTDGEGQTSPVVFVVPSATVADSIGPTWSRYRFYLKESAGAQYLERWDRITKQLTRCD